MKLRKAKLEINEVKKHRERASEREREERQRNREREKILKMIEGNIVRDLRFSLYFVILIQSLLPILLKNVLEFCMACRDTLPQQQKSV